MKCYQCGTELSPNETICKKCNTSQVFSEELIQEARDGNQKAITELYNRTYSSVYQSVRVMIRDEDTVLDIVQDSYIQAFKSLYQLKEANKFRAWIKRIAHNKTVDYLRRSKPVMFSEMVSSDSEQMSEIKDERVESMPEAVIDQKETTRLIDEILNELPDQQRLVIVMYYYENISVKEIAEQLNLSENTVKSQLNYSRKKIKAQVEALEKKGTKLYNLAPIPFLLFLFQGMETQAAEIPSQVVLHTVQKECASAVATNVLKATITKAIVGITTVAAIGTGIALYNKPIEPHYVKDYKELKSKDIEVITDFANDYIEQFFEEEDWITVVNENGESIRLYDEDMEEAEKSVKLEDWCYFAVDQEDQSFYGYGFAPNMIYIPCTINVDGNEYARFITILGVYMTEDKSITVSQDFNLDLVVFSNFYESMDLLEQEEIENSGYLQGSYKVSKENLK